MFCFLMKERETKRVITFQYSIEYISLDILTKQKASKNINAEEKNSLQRETKKETEKQHAICWSNNELVYRGMYRKCLYKTRGT